MNRIYHLIALSVLAISNLTHCGLGGNDSNKNTAQIRQNKLIEDLYGPLVGTYSCKITKTQHGDEDAQLILYISSSPGTNPDGTPGTKKYPLAIFRRLSPVVADYTLNPSGYTQESGELSMNASGKGGDIDSILGKMVGKQFSGTIQTASSGQLGEVNCTWVTANTGTDQTVRDRLLKAYQAVAGLYKGSIISPDSSKPPIPVSLELAAIEDGATPTITGYYKRLDVPSGDIDLAMKVDYRPDNSPPQITLNGKGGLNYQVNMDGVLFEDQIQVEVNTLYNGYLGKLVAKLVSRPTPVAGDLYSEYLKVAGTYTGSIVKRISKKKRTVIILTLTLSAERQGTSAVLLANLKRSDHPHPKGDTVEVPASLNLSQNPAHFKVTLDGGDGELNTLDGTLQGSQIQLTVQTPSEGLIGSSTLVRSP